MIDLQGQVAIITGAVGNLGVATAKAFYEAGARMALVDRSEKRLREAYPDLSTVSDHVLIGDVDLTDAASVATMTQRAFDRLGRIDILVNTVGGFRGGKPLDQDDLDNWDFLFGLNVRTTIQCCRAVVPYMRRAGRGKIINIGSRAALAGGAGLSAYCASKSAVLRLTESLAQELKQVGIHVNCLLPGTIDTPQNRQAMPDADRSSWVHPKAIADVIVFLASDASRAITGAGIPV